MGIYAEAVQKLYVAYFNRPADALGLIYWEEQIAKNGGSAAAVANAFSASQEYKDLYAGKDSANIVNAIYMNLFGRPAEVDGLLYWGSRLENKTFDIGTIATAILNGAQNDDKKVIENKTAAAVEFTKALDTTAEITAYSGNAANTIAKAWLAAVTATADSLTAAKAAVASTITSIGSGTVANGQTFTLTTGADNLTGTANNDTFNGLVDGTSTLTAADKIIGGAGVDTLNITVTTGTAVLNGADVQGVEKLYVRNVGTGAAAVDAQGAPGVTTVVSDRSTGTLDVTNLENNGVIAIKGNGSVVIGNVTAGYKATATNANIEADGGTATGSGSITVNAGAALVSANITSTSAANVIGGVAFTAGAVKAVTVDAQSNVTTGNITGLAAGSTITVKGAGTANIGTLLATNVTKVDASANTGGVTATLNNVTTLSFTGGSGNDVITTGAVLAGAGLVDAGAGSADRLVVAASAHVDATAGKLYKGFEQLQVNDGVSVDVTQLATNNAIDTVRINDAGGATGVTNLSAAQAAKVSIVAANATGAITIDVKDASVGGQIDTVKAAVTTTTSAGAAQAMNLTGIVLAGVEKLELTGSGTVASATGAITLTTAAATSLDSIKFANAADGNSITIAAGQTATNLNVDASASTGGVTIDASLYATATGATLTGGKGVDIIEGSANGDSIVGGDGNDVLSGTATAGQTAGTATAIGSIATSIAASTVADKFTGGAGRDVFGVGTNSTISNFSHITDLDLGGATAATGVDALVFDLTTPGGTTAPVVITLTDTQKTAITGAASFAAAVDAALAIGSTVNNVVQFTYGTDSYLVVNGATANATYQATEDLIVKITGVTGTLDASDITIL